VNASTPLPPGSIEPPIAPIQIVICFETDDYTNPRGYTLPDRREYVFHSLYAGGNCPPGVRRGRLYAVDHERRVLGEALIPEGCIEVVAEIRANIEQRVVRWGPAGRPW